MSEITEEQSRGEAEVGFSVEDKKEEWEEVSAINLLCDIVSHLSLASLDKTDLIRPDDDVKLPCSILDNSTFYFYPCDGLQHLTRTTTTTTATTTTITTTSNTTTTKCTTSTESNKKELK